MYLVVLLYALFAGVFTVAKSALEYTQPCFLVGIRMAVAGILLLAYQYSFHREKLTLSKGAIWRIFLLAILNIYLTNIFEFWGLQYLTSSKTCFIYSLSPFLSAIFCYFLFKEKLSGKKWVGLLIGFLGMVPVLLSQSSGEELAGQFLIFSWAEISVLGAVICSVYGWILLSQLIKENGVSPMMANGLSMLLGGGMALVHSSFVENWNPIPVTEFWPFLERTLLLMVLSNLIAYNLYGYLLKKYTATFISFAGFTTPLFTALFGWFFLSETVTLTFYISTVIVFAGLTLFHQEELKHGYKQPISI